MNDRTTSAVEEIREALRAAVDAAPEIRRQLRSAIGRLAELPTTHCLAPKGECADAAVEAWKEAEARGWARGRAEGYDAATKDAAEFCNVVIDGFPPSSLKRCGARAVRNRIEQGEHVGAADRAKATP